MTIDFVEDVVPISDLRTKASQIIARARQTKQPVLVTQRGRSVIVLLDVTEYQRQRRKMALLEHIAAGKRDVAAGRVYSQEQIEADPETWLAQDGL
jgi:prevent-host-death family protein